MTIQDREQTLSEIYKLHSEVQALEEQATVAKARIKAKKAQIRILSRLLDGFNEYEKKIYLMCPSCNMDNLIDVEGVYNCHSCGYKTGIMTSKS